MSQLSKQDLKAENQLSFPNNNNGAITPADLRAFNVDMIDSTVNQTSFDSFSGSVANEFANITGSTIATGSFATTGSNTFTGNQTINADLTVSQSKTLAIGVNGAIRNATNGITLFDTTGGNQTRNFTTGEMYFEQNANNNLYVYNRGGAPVVISGSATQIQGVDFIPFSQSVDARILAATGSVTSAITASSLITASFDNGTRNLTFTKGDNTTFNVNIPDVSGSAGDFATTGSNTFTGNQNIQGTLTASLAQGFTYVGNSSNISVLVATSSFGTAIDTGSFATTGSNTFTGIQTFQDQSLNATSLVSTSGSLMLVAKTFNSSSTHITASAGNQVNLIFKNSNNNRDTIVSGSNNIFTNPPSTGIAGFKAYMGSANIMLTTGAGGDPFSYITASAQFSPTVNNNILNGGNISMRCPVSASGAWTIQRNYIGSGGFNFGTSAVPNPGINSLSCNNNILLGGNVNFTTPFNLGAAGVSLLSNIINGAPTFALNSGSINMNQSNINGGFTFTNNASGSQIIINRMNIGGNSHTITARNVGTASSYSDNIIFGQQNQVAIDLSQTNNTFNGNNILGVNLIVTASGVFADNTYNGSLFTGRNSAVDGNKALTAQTVFAVGTGTATVRKTGFLIDSGSNTFVEGTLNVSGSTTMTGSLTIQSGSGDLFVHGNKQFNVGTFFDTTTQSGSAAVSQSMKFNTTDISKGVSIVSNSQITLANSGTYNIQFSAQVLADTGADDVYIWLKKNGTNVPSSAGVVYLANNQEVITSWNYVVEAVANDYYELCWQSTNGDAVLLTETATGNVPGIPSVILTVTQVR